MKVDLSEIVEGWNTFLDCLQAMLQKQGVVTPSRPARVSRSPSRIFIQKNLLKQWAAGEELTVPLESAEPVPAVEAAEARPRLQSTSRRWEWMPVSTSGSLNVSRPFVCGHHATSIDSDAVVLLKFRVPFLPDSCRTACCRL